VIMIVFSIGVMIEAVYKALRDKCRNTKQ
jgi:hypothetical protein